MEASTCSICLFEYDSKEHRPKLLACGHEYCYACLKQIHIHNNKDCIPCPNCRMKHNVKPKHLSVVYSLINSNSRSTSCNNATTTSGCQKTSCSKKGYKYCEHCGRNLCQTHYQDDYVQVKNLGNMAIIDSDQEIQKLNNSLNQFQNLPTNINDKVKKLQQRVKTLVDNKLDSCAKFYESIPVHNRMHFEPFMKITVEIGREVPTDHEIEFDSMTNLLPVLDDKKTKIINLRDQLEQTMTRKDAQSTDIWRDLRKIEIFLKESETIHFDNLHRQFSQVSENVNTLSKKVEQLDLELETTVKEHYTHTFKNFTFHLLQVESKLKETQAKVLLNLKIKLDDCKSYLMYAQSAQTKIKDVTGTVQKTTIIAKLVDNLMKLLEKEQSLLEKNKNEITDNYHKLLNRLADNRNTLTSKYSSCTEITTSDKSIWNNLHELKLAAVTSIKDLHSIKESIEIVALLGKMNKLDEIEEQTDNLMKQLKFYNRSLTTKSVISELKHDVIKLAFTPSAICVIYNPNVKENQLLAACGSQLFTINQDGAIVNKTAITVSSKVQPKFHDENLKPNIISIVYRKTLSKILFTNNRSNKIWIADVDDGNVTEFIGQNMISPKGLFLDEKSGYLYICDIEMQSIHIVLLKDGTTSKVLQDPSITTPRACSINFKHQELWIANCEPGGQICIFSTQDYKCKNDEIKSSKDHVKSYMWSIAHSQNDGRCFVSSDHCITELCPSACTLRQIGNLEPGKSKDEFCEPRDIKVTENSLFVLDRGNHRIHRFTFEDNI